MTATRLRLAQTAACALLAVGASARYAYAASGTAGTQCQIVPSAVSAASAVSASPGSSSTTAQLCLSIQAGQSSIRSGQAATFTIIATTQDGSAPDVTITLTAGPAGQSATFIASCPAGNGDTSCELGDLGTDVTPATYQTQAQIKIPATASITAVTLTASAQTSPALPAGPVVSATVTVTAPPSPAPSPAPRLTTASPAPQSTATVPAVAPVPSITVTLPVNTGPPPSAAGLLPVPTALASDQLTGHPVAAHATRLILGMKPVAYYLITFLALALSAVVIATRILALRRRWRRRRARTTQHKPVISEPAISHLPETTPAPAAVPAPAPAGTTGPDPKHREPPGQYLG